MLYKDGTYSAEDIENFSSPMLDDVDSIISGKVKNQTGFLAEQSGCPNKVLCCASQAHAYTLPISVALFYYRALSQ